MLGRRGGEVRLTLTRHDSSTEGDVWTDGERNLTNEGGAKTPTARGNFGTLLPRGPDQLRAKVGCFKAYRRVTSAASARYCRSRIHIRPGRAAVMTRTGRHLLFGNLKGGRPAGTQQDGAAQTAARHSNFLNIERTPAGRMYKHQVRVKAGSSRGTYTVRIHTLCDFDSFFYLHKYSWCFNSSNCD